MVDFRINTHKVVPNVNIVEILIGGEVVGVIYPTGEKSIKVVSAHILDTLVEDGFAGEVVKDDGGKSYPPIPAVLIQFDPSPYIIVGRKIVRLPPELR